MIRWMAVCVLLLTVSVVEPRVIAAQREVKQPRCSGDECLSIWAFPGTRIAVPQRVRAHFAEHDNMRAQYSLWNAAYVTPWIRLGPAGCDDGCLNVEWIPSG